VNLRKFEVIFSDVVEAASVIFRGSRLQELLAGAPVTYNLHAAMPSFVFVLPVWPLLIWA